MAYADRNTSGSRVVSIVIVSIIVALFAWGFVNGLTFKYIKKVTEKLNTFDVVEPPPPPPPEPPVTPSAGELKPAPAPPPLEFIAVVKSAPGELKLESLPLFPAPSLIGLDAPPAPITTLKVPSSTVKAAEGLQ